MTLTAPVGPITSSPSAPGSRRPPFWRQRLGRPVWRCRRSQLRSRRRRGWLSVFEASMATWLQIPAPQQLHNRSHRGRRTLLYRNGLYAGISIVISGTRCRTPVQCGLTEVRRSELPLQECWPKDLFGEVYDDAPTATTVTLLNDVYLRNAATTSLCEKGETTLPTPDERRQLSQSQNAGARSHSDWQRSYFGFPGRAYRGGSLRWNQACRSQSS